MIDILIIGARFSGLYLFYELNKLNNNLNILLLEKNNKVGGVIQTTKLNNNILFENSAWRILKTQKEILYLIQELNISIRLVKTNVFNMDEFQKTEEYFIIENGFEILIKKLHSAIPKNKILLNHNVINIQKIAEGYNVITENNSFLCKQVFLTINTPNIINYDIYPQINKIFENSIDIQYCKIYILNESKISYKNYDSFDIFTPTVFNRTLSNPHYSNWLLASYTKKINNIKHIEDMINKNILRDNLIQYLEQLFDNINILDIHYDFYNTKMLNTKNNFIEIYHNFYVFGSIFTNKWLNHSIQSVHSIINHLFKPQISVNYVTEIDFIIDQNDFSSCSANAMVNIFYLSLKKQNYPLFLCSSLYLYYNTRILMGNTQKDIGSTYDCLFEAIQKFGMIPERMWSIDNDEHLKNKPSEECYEFAKNFPWKFEYSEIKIDVYVISQTLMDQKFILCNINGYENQYINNDGFLITDYSSIEKNTGHSIVILGIDFHKEKIICLNSHGIYRESINGFFCISFQELYETKLIINMFEIYTRFLSREFHPCILETIEYFNETENHNIPISKKNHYILNFGIYYDHIIIGGGITGSYMAYRLQKEYPNDSILIIDENFENSTIQTLNNDFIHTTTYKTHLTEPIIMNLISEFDLEIKIMPNDNILDLSILSRLKKDFKSFLNIQDIKEIVLEKIYNDPYLCSIYFTIFLDKYNYSISDREILLKYNESLLERMSFPIALSYFLPYLSETNKWIQIDYTHLILNLRKSFQNVSINDLIKKQPKYAYLKDFFAKIDTNKNLVIFKRNNIGYQISDSIIIFNQECYFCSSFNQTEIINYPMIKRPFLRFYIFCKNPLIVNKNYYNKILGKIIFISKYLIFIDIRINKTYTQLLSTKPLYIQNGIIYNLIFWKELHSMIHHEFDIFNPISFISFHYNSSLFKTFDTLDNKNTLLKIMKSQLNIYQNIHWINSNLSFLYCSIEGSLQQVDYFFRLKNHFIFVFDFDLTLTSKSSYGIPNIYDDYFNGNVSNILKMFKILKILKIPIYINTRGIVYKINDYINHHIGKGFIKKIYGSNNEEEMINPFNNEISDILFEKYKNVDKNNLLWALQKTKFLDIITNNENVLKKNVYFFDDVVINIKIAQKNGFINSFLVNQNISSLVLDILYSKFYSTPQEYVSEIFDNIRKDLENEINILDIGAGLGTLSRPFIENKDLRYKLIMIENNDIFINVLKNFENNNISVFHIDFLKTKDEFYNKNINVIIMNPPFEILIDNQSIKYGYLYFLYKAFNVLKNQNTESIKYLYIICPKTFFVNRKNLIQLEIPNNIDMEIIKNLNISSIEQNFHCEFLNDVRGYQKSVSNNEFIVGLYKFVISV
jgi:predicted RNA methylase